MEGRRRVLLSSERTVVGQRRPLHPLPFPPPSSPPLPSTSHLHSVKTSISFIPPLSLSLSFSLLLHLFSGLSLTVREISYRE